MASAWGFLFKRRIIVARPIKEGFDYFPLDVHLSKEIKAVESVFKNNGFVWIIKIWQEAYQHNDGIVNLHGYHGIVHAENCGITKEEHNKILEMCLEIGLLYKTGEDKYTSNGIQKRLSFLLKERARWRSTHKNELSTGITPEIRGESKVNKSKVNNISIYGDTEKPTAKRSLGQKAVDVYLLKYKDITGLDYIPSWGKHVRLLNTVLKNMRGEEYEECVDRFLSSQKGREVKYSLDFFIATINTWRETSD